MSCNAIGKERVRSVWFMALASCLLSAVAASDAQGAETPWRGRILAMTGDDREPVIVRDADGEAVLDPYYEFDRKGLALVDMDYSLRLEGGLFYGEATREYLGEALKNSGNAVTLGVYVRPRKRAATGEARGCLAAYGDPEKTPLMAVWQDKDKLVLTLGADKPVEIKLLQIENKAPFHLAVAVGPDQITWYRNAVRGGKAEGFKGDMAKWPAGMPFFGNARKGAHPWRGRVEFFELHNRTLNPEEIQAMYANAKKEIKGRPGMPSITFEGALLARSEYPKPWDPGYTYSEVLSVCEYRVEKLVSGEYTSDKIRVAEWMFVDRIFLTNSRKPVGSRHRLTVEPLDQHAHLSTIERADTLELDMDAEVYYARGPIEALPPDEQPKGGK